MRTQETLYSLDAVIDHLMKEKSASGKLRDPDVDWLMWVGKNYSKGALIQDLRREQMLNMVKTCKLRSENAALAFCGVFCLLAILMWTT